MKFLSQAEHLLQAVSRIQLACGCSQGHSLLPLPPRLYPWAAEEASSFLKLPQLLRAARELLPLGLPIRALLSADLCEGLFSGGTLKPPESLQAGREAARLSAAPQSLPRHGTAIPAVSLGQCPAAPGGLRSFTFLLKLLFYSHMDNGVPHVFPLSHCRL